VAVVVGVQLTRLELTAQVVEQAVLPDRTLARPILVQAVAVDLIILRVEMVVQEQWFSDMKLHIQPQFLAQEQLYLS
jgi:hypothetical protein